MASTDQVTAAAAILRGESPKPAPTRELSTDLPPERAEPVTEPEKAPAPQRRTLGDLAKALRTEVEDLYEVEIPLGGEGKSFKLGEFKDRVQALQELDTERSVYSEHRAKAEQKLLRERAELTAVLNLVGPRLSREDLEKAAPYIEQMRERERKAALDVIPDWADDNRRKSDLDMMARTAGKWGFSEAEIRTAVEGDHRLAAMFRHFASREQEAARIVAEKPKKLGVTPQATKQLSGAAQYQSLKKQVGSGQLKPEAAVAQLLRGK